MYIYSISLLLLFFTHPLAGQIRQLVQQVLSWACCARAAHHGVYLSFPFFLAHNNSLFAHNRFFALFCLVLQNLQMGNQRDS